MQFSRTKFFLAVFFHSYDLQKGIFKKNETQLIVCMFQTVLSYYEVACMYGIQDLKDAAFSWLLLNLITYYSCNFDRLQKIR